MIVQDVVEEIIEKMNWANPDYGMSVDSILRKVTNVRDDLIRNYGPAQRQADAVVTQLDLLNGKSQYPLPCPPGNVVDVDVKGLWRGMYGGFLPCDCQDNWVQPLTYNTGTVTDDTPSVGDIPDCWFRMPYRQFDEHYNGPYYYFLSGTIGLVPKPCQDVPGGLKIFHVPVLGPLTKENLNGPTGFDPNFDMVLVFGVLKDVLTGAQAQEYVVKYQQWVLDYQRASNGFERFTVDLRW
ncbi:phage adaptor protein [Paenibacillus sp. GYB003]|uniref:phage adaptor protein n=1 Tax=Paenibacillus sp. GYB003 TaxID=2994392 RepID=UPI002F9637B2